MGWTGAFPVQTESPPFRSLPNPHNLPLENEEIWGNDPIDLRSISVSDGVETSNYLGGSSQLVSG